MKAAIRDARVSIWKPEPSVDSTIGSYFGEPIPGSTIIEGLKITFSVEKDTKSTANKATVSITNLSKRTRAELNELPRRLLLEAGYGGKLSVLAVGDISASPGIQDDGKDSITTLLVKDGGRALKFARVDKAYRGPMTALQLAQESIAAMGLRAPDNLASYSELQKQYPNGFTLSGLASDQLTETLRPFGIGWSIQNGKVVIGKAEEVSDSDMLLIDAAAGMIGSPELAPPSKAGEKPTLSVRCFLFPELEPGRKVLVVSRNITGEFKITGVKHEGDTMGGDMLTEIEAKPA